MTQGHPYLRGIMPFRFVADQMWLLTAIGRSNVDTSGQYEPSVPALAYYSHGPQ